MRIILDTMGGDNAPDALVRGALLAQKEQQADITLVGHAEKISCVLKAEGLDVPPPGMDIVHASQVITMEDHPSSAIKEKPDSSVVVGLRLLAEGRGDALVSAGNTGALLTGATLIVKRIKGIRRAALSPLIPTVRNGSLLIDCGANVECTPEHLLQFAFMGSLYVQHVVGIDKPRVGLLNIGAEESKGDELHRQVYRMLRQVHEEGRILFIGNVEGRDITSGVADVVVADGFSGNIMLKTTEGMGLFFADLMKQILKKNMLTKLGALSARSDLRNFAKMVDYSEHGGAPFLGVSRPVIKAHGSSNPRATASAVRQAIHFAESGVTQKIMENIDYMTVSVTEGTV